MALGGARERLGNLVEGIVPGDRREFSGTLRPDPAERAGEAVRVMEALVIARDLGADHARGVGIAVRASHLAEPAAVQSLDLERAHARAIVRADRGQEFAGHDGSFDDGDRHHHTGHGAPG